VSLSSQNENHGRAARATEDQARAFGIPFFNVVINPTILDGKGERMSKSKGNGVDPVDIIDSYGADALRFTLTKMATETQDARMPVKRDASGKNTSEKFDEGRNFCNKLWNACRFALSNLENVKAEEAAVPEGFEPAVLGKTSDEDLMQAVQRGDQKAFSILYERYSASVLFYLYRMLGNVEDVETIGQEVFLRAFRFAETYQYPHRFSSWLFTITRNLAISAPRREKRAVIRNLPELDFTGIDMTGTPRDIAARATDDLQKQEEIARVLAALDSLPAGQKEVILLGVFQDLSYEAMEKLTGTDAAALRTRMFEGLKGLGTALPDVVAAFSPSVSPSLPPSLSPSPMTLADRWIIGRFNRTVAEADDALKNYRFDVYAKACYDFFWRDFCDWYVEAIKPAMKDPARAPQTANVLAAVLDGSLRLMHPMIPFITETVWWRLNDVRPQRGLPGLLECPPSKRLVLAQWPKAPSAASTSFSPGGHAGSSAHDPARPPGLNEDELNAGAASNGDMDDSQLIFPRLQEIISSIRTIRNDYQVNPKQTVPVSIKSPPDFTGQIESNRELIELLGNCALKAVQSDLAPPQNSVTATAGGCDLFVEGLVDANAEKARLSKEIEAKKKSIEGMKTRLGNESYVAKAPLKVVQQTRDQLAAIEAEVGKMEVALRKLQ
jgi:RNA polymerase sigma factor (sigma-70 family)